MMLPRHPARRLAAAVLVGGLAVASVTACSGGDDPVAENTELDDDGDGEVTPEEVMAAAKEHLDSTSGVEIRLATDDAPDGGDYLAEAEGTLVADPPAFEGKVTGEVMGVPAADVPVVAVDGDLHVDVPLLGWDTFDPERFCAPDPAGLLDPETGVSPTLTATEDLEAGEAERGGADNEEVLTPYTGTVPGDTVRNLLPCADGDAFEATYRIDADGRLAQAEITGAFFPGTEAITYTIDVLAYDVEKDISAPE